MINFHLCGIYRKFIIGHFVIILVKLLLFILYFLHVHWFYFLGRNNRQQTNDEEKLETHQLLSPIDRENDRDGVYLFERNVQYKYNSLKLQSSFLYFCAIRFQSIKFIL